MLKRILSIGPPKQADAAIFGYPCLAIAVLETRSKTKLKDF
jgi:hypothetical protein